MEKSDSIYIIVILGILACSACQLLLKKSADKHYPSFLHSLLNWRVLLAYSIYFSSLLINVTAMSYGFEMKNLPILESLGYVFVPLLAFLVLKEKISLQTISSIILIFIGIVVFYM